MLKIFQASNHGHDGDSSHGDHGHGKSHGDHGHSKSHGDHGHGKSHTDHGHGGHGHGSIEVKIENDDIIEEELGQVALDILDCSEKIVIIAPIAWIDTDSVDIAVSRNILTISGERRRPEAYDMADRILVEECFYGAFSRSVILPENLALNKIHADMENNLLSIEIPKLVFGEKTIKINKLER